MGRSSAGRSRKMCSSNSRGSLLAGVMAVGGSGGGGSRDDEGGGEVARAWAGLLRITSSAIASGRVAYL